MGCFLHILILLQGILPTTSPKWTFQISLEEDLKIHSTECDCPWSEFKCSHAAVLFIYGIHKLSQADVECSWKKQKATYSKQLSQQTKCSFLQRSLQGCPEPHYELDSAWLYKALPDYSRTMLFTGLCWLMSSDKDNTSPINTVQSITTTEEFLTQVRDD